MTVSGSSSTTSAAATDVIWICWNGKYGVRLIAWRRLGRKRGSTHHEDPLPSS